MHETFHLKISKSKKHQGAPLNFLFSGELVGKQQCGCCHYTVVLILKTSKKIRSCKTLLKVVPLISTPGKCI